MKTSFDKCRLVVVEDPSAMVQKSVLEGQMSVSLLVVLVSGGAWPCKDGENGEFFMDTFWQVSHTVSQKLLVAWLLCDEFDETVELQSTGTWRGLVVVVNSSAENGSHR